jgi:hypothetical protein
MSLCAGDLVLAGGFPCIALVLEEGLLAWHAADGIRSGTPDEFLAGRNAEILRLPDPLKRQVSGAFPPSMDPRHTSIEERELVAFLLSGQSVLKEEVLPWIIAAAKVQLGHDFLVPDSSAQQQEAAAVLFILNSLRVAECCHGVIPHAALSLDDLRAGNFQRLSL